MIEASWGQNLTFEWPLWYANEVKVINIYLAYRKGSYSILHAHLMSIY